MKSSVSRPSVGVILCAAGLVAIGSPLHAQPASDVGPALDPSSPLDIIPGFGVDWPDMSAPDAPIIEEPGSIDQPSEPATPVKVEAPSQSETDVTADQRYSVTIEGLDGNVAQRIRGRFDALSTLKQGQGASANTAQIDRRAREDETLLRDLLRSEGYYGASVVTEVDSSNSHVRVILRVDSGPIYQFTAVSIEGLEAGDAQAVKSAAAFTIKTGDPVNAETVLAATENLRKTLGDNGFPFAKVEEPAVTINHAERTAVLTLKTDPGHFARFGDIEIKSKGRPPFGKKHIRRIARFKPGHPYNIADVDDLRRALIATGLVSSVTLTPVATTDPGVVNLEVALESSPPRTIAGELGYGTGEGFRAAVSWTHRNLIKPEGEITFRGVAGTQEQVLGASLRRHNFKRRDRVLMAQITASHLNRRAFDAKTFTLGAGLERQTNIIWQKKWTWSISTELLISDERDTVVATGLPRRRTFYIAALPGSLAYDGSDDLLNPTRGFRLSARLSPEVSFRSGTFAYARAQVDSSFYQPLTGRTVIAGRVRIGSIFGASRDQIAPSRRFYAGGGGSVRGYGYQDIGPRDVDNTPIGGRSIAEFSVEARVRFGDFGVVPFLDGGNIYTQARPRFTGLRYGAGLGARYYTTFGPIRVDVGTPLNRRKGDARVAVYVSLGQAF
jgi:translocation and assembly module TamA